MPTAALFLSPAGEVRALNCEAEQLYGWRREEALGKSYAESLLSESERQVLLTKVGTVLAGAPASTVQHMVTHRVDGQRVLSCTLSRIGDEGGQPAGVLVIAREVTGERQEELSASESTFRAVISTSLVAVVVVDRDLRVTAFNEMANEVSRAVLGRGLVKGRSVFEYVDPRLLDIFQGQFGPALRGEAVTVERNIALHGREDAWFQFNFVPVPCPETEDGGAEGRCVAVFAIDVSERKRAEAALRESEAALRAIFDSIADVYFRTDLGGTVQMISPSMGRYGYQAQDLVGTDIRALCYDPANWDRLVEFLIEHGAVSDVELPGRHEDGTPVPSSVNAHLLHDSEGRPIGIEGMVRDIATRKRAEEAAQRQQAEFAHVLRLTSLGYMATELAHELHQPLAAIANYASGCAMRIRPDTPESAELLATVKRISAEVLRAGEILRRARRLTRKAEPQRERVDMNGLVGQVGRRVEAEAKEQGVTICLDLAAGSAVVEADGVQIEQVVLNLVWNALEAMDGSCCADRSLVLRTWEKQGEFGVSVGDCGLGLPASGRIFEPFFSTKPDGLGMGLAISRSIVEAHGGRLWATSNADCGATFSFTLPA